MTLKRNLNSKKGVKMLEKILEKEAKQLPEEKTIADFGGGYVECLKTKAKVVLYFGFDKKRNRCQITFDVDRSDVLLWQEAIAEKIWNSESSKNMYTFDDGEITTDAINFKYPIYEEHHCSKCDMPYKSCICDL